MRQYFAENIIKYSPYSWKEMPRFIIDKFWYQFLEIDRWALSRLEFANLEKLADIQKTKLKFILELARNNTIYWKNVIKETNIDDPYQILKSLPILTRNTIKNNNLAIFTVFQNKWRRKSVITSGTTTSPMEFYADKLTFLRMEAAIKNILGFKKNNDLIRINLKFPPFRPLGQMYLFSLTNGLKQNTQWMIDTLKQKKPTHIFTTASSALELALIFEHGGISYPLRSISLVGEHLILKDKKFIEKTMCCPALELYASREAGGPIAYECAEQGGMHINTASFFIEILDDNGDEKKTGEEGNIVITMFENMVMPFIRYRIGDRGYVIKEPCRCGRETPRLYFKGREAQSVVLKNCHTSSITALTSFIRDFAPPILQFQFEQRRRGEIITRLAPAKPLTQKDIENIETTAKGFFSGQLDMKIEICSKIPGKNVLFIKKTG